MPKVRVSPPLLLQKSSSDPDPLPPLAAGFKWERTRLRGSQNEANTARMGRGQGLSCPSSPSLPPIDDDDGTHRMKNESLMRAIVQKEGRGSLINEGSEWTPGQGRVCEARVPLGLLREINVVPALL